MTLMVERLLRRGRSVLLKILVVEFKKCNIWTMTFMRSVVVDKTLFFYGL